VPWPAAIPFVNEEISRDKITCCTMVASKSCHQMIPGVNKDRKIPLFDMYKATGLEVVLPDLTD
jgi:hypothetical protein